MRMTPLSPDRLAERIAERIAGLPASPRPRVVVDGAPAAEPGDLATALVGRLRRRGREVFAVSADDFPRPAALRLERGRTNPDAYYEDWTDVGALRREVLTPLGPDGDGRALPRLWDAASDRSARASRVRVDEGTVLLVSGGLLLGHGLPWDLAVHLWLSEPALRRRTTAERGWTLPAFDRYEREVAPREVADVVVRVDHPDRPAVLER
ncbi:uridine kinase [Actinoalloteichus caeruleus]|uniref:Uridine kinase n=1 Tax=Actinoalloteichus caeruleus DSM 43889 TaxID=1120930 RepID=A0ABT1JCU4_ACTCY|nr:uridine kinase [Actinoalloteichus caeruleus]MCP2329986.1 hypothetical protein [Actinoalloteichus caeruleus DSM 43889]